MKIININVPELIKKIEEYENDHVDSHMLANFVKLLHQLGLKKGEVLKLKIEDVVDDAGEVVEQINIGKRKMAVSSEVEAIIKDQIDYLNDNDTYNADRNFPLFQNKKGSEYSQVAHQLRQKFNSPELEKIRQSGLIDYFASLNKLSDKDRMKEMEDFTGLSPKQIYGILTGRIQKPGRKKAIYENDLSLDEIIEYLENQNNIKFDELNALPEKINKSELDNMSRIERLKKVEILRNAYFDAVDTNEDLNKDAEGLDEEKKANSKRNLKEGLLEKLNNAGILFDPATNKPRIKTRSAVKRKGNTIPKDLVDLIKAHH